MSSAQQDETPEKKEKNIFLRRTIDINDLSKVLKKGANHGLCGGHNLGNTCFMNSSIACLSNCTELTTYFLTGQFKDNVNTKNKEGVQGQLAYAWNNLLQEYWNSNSGTGNPSQVKSAVAKKVRKFGGYSQQDSNEFMTEFLSLLSEDLNKTTKKVYRELKEKGENESEIDCAKRFWDLHVQLNDSIITDLFSGLFKSEVHCNKCNFDNITFDPFNTLTLPIPSSHEIYSNWDDIFYIPKYSIRKSCRFNVRNAKNNLSLKNIMEELNTIEDFKYKLKKLKYIQVIDQKLVRFVNEDEAKKYKEYIFVFDDLSKEGEKTKVIPLYLYSKNSISSFPRLLFLEENMNFGQRKKQIYYFARNYFTSPLKGNNVDEELKIYKEQKEEYDEQKLWDLFDNEYKDIFELGDESKKEDIDKFMDDFPFLITFNKNKNDEHNTIFDGKNNLEQLKEFDISKDEDPITNLLNKIEKDEYCLNLEINNKSSYTVEKINLNVCVPYKKEMNKENIDFNLDTLLKYFSSKEYLDKGNEWRCSKCNNKVEASKKLSIYYVPRLLIICLSRFSREGRYGYGKNNSLIDFPLDNLDMGPYICGPYKENSKYDLFAVSQHYGGTGGGHYTAICKNIDGNWYNYNDSSCSRSSAGNVVSSAAYVLFYRRRTW